MIETYYVGAYWGGRKESAGECARRAEIFMRHLANCDPLFARWSEQAHTLKKALERQFDPTQATFEAFFKKKKYQCGNDGFIFSAWTGDAQHEQAAAVRFTCGAALDITGNACVINLPNEDPNAARVRTAPVMASMLRAAALAWEPTWGISMSDAHRELLPREVKLQGMVGWVTYLSRSRGTVPPLPSPVQVEEVEDKGTLITLTPERFTASNPEHLALAARVRQALDEAGLLGPIQP